ncbi:MAG: PEP-CTERM sorting domain-containing protein [Kiloniellaceae bacterium]
MMKTIMWSLCVAAAACLFAAPASAIPVTWYLYDANFSSGGSASGSFVYDADVNQYSGIDLPTTTDGTRAGSHFTSVNATSSGNASTMITLNGPLTTGTWELALGFAAPLTNAGGMIDVVPYPSGFTVEGICNNDLCTGIDAPFRFLQAGAFVSTTQQILVSEPGALGLFALGLAGLAYLRRRQSAL